MNDMVVRVDLRDPEVHERLLRSAPGAELGRLYSTLQIGGTRLAPLPMRTIVVLEVGGEASPQLAAMAMSLLGGDPSPRAIVALVPPSREPEAQPGGFRIIPAEFAQFTGVRFLDLRSSLVCIGHPRTGPTHIPAGPSAAWAEAFERDLLERLEERPLFDVVWEQIPSGRPAVIGMRIAGLGEGRDLAVADLCLRLAKELAPDHEPQTGSRLPSRWAMDDRMLPARPPYPTFSDVPSLPTPLRRLVSTSSARFTTVLRRNPSAYNSVAEEALRAATSDAGLGDRPRKWADLFEGAEADAEPDEGPIISAQGAEALDRALGGNVVFGDDFARAFETGEDAAFRVEDFLKVAADRQADGLSASILAGWLREDAARIRPIGPRAVAESLRARVRGIAPDKAASPDGESSEEPAAIPQDDALSWMRHRAGGQHQTLSADGTPEGPGDPGRIPGGVGIFAGSPIWRNRWLGIAFISLLVVLTAVRIAQIVATAAGIPIPSAADLGMTQEFADALALVVSVLVVLGWIYAFLSYLAASAIRSWAGEFGFHTVPDALAGLESEVRAVAIAEVARCAPRRKMAQALEAAAETLECGCETGASTARAMGEQIRDAVATEATGSGSARRSETDAPPHRELLTRGSMVAGTDAGGIYRLYPLYVNALRAMFSQALVQAVREWWPRIRGEFQSGTSSIIAEGASMALQRRLNQVRAAGLRRGDLLRDGIDPAEELARTLWSDPLIRDSARRSLSFGPDDPMPMLAGPVDMRLLEDPTDQPLILAVPSTLEGLMTEGEHAGRQQILVEDLLESATAIRVYPYKAGYYDIADLAKLAPPTS